MLKYKIKEKDKYIEDMQALADDESVQVVDNPKEIKPKSQNLHNRLSRMGPTTRNHIFHKRQNLTNNAPSQDYNNSPKVAST